MSGTVYIAIAATLTFYHPVGERGNRDFPVEELNIVGDRYTSKSSCVSSLLGKSVKAINDGFSATGANNPEAKIIFTSVDELDETNVAASRTDYRGRAMIIKVKEWSFTITYNYDQGKLDYYLPDVINYKWNKFVCVPLTG